MHVMCHKKKYETTKQRVERNGAEQAINACLLLVMLFFVVFITCRKNCVVDTLWHWKVDSCEFMSEIKMNTITYAQTQTQTHIVLCWLLL